MPSITDLKTTKEDTGMGIANDDIIVIENPNIKKEDEPKDKSKRTVADLSSLPKDEPVGVKVVKGSYEEELFKAGGEFDQYLSEKKAEMQAVNDLIDQHNEMVAASRGEEVPDNDLIENKDLSVVLAGTEFDKPSNKAEKTANKNIEAAIDLSFEEEADDDMKDLVDDSLETVDIPVAKTAKEEEKVVPLEEQLQPKKDYHDDLDKAILSPKTSAINLDIDEDDFAELEEEPASTKDEDKEDEENFKILQASITEKIKPVNDKLDLTSFKIVSTPISVSSASIQAQLENYHVADWALMSSGVHIGMKEFRGKEIEKLADNAAGSRFNNMKNRYKLFYDHLVEKPDSFETWLKSTSYLDNDHLYFALFMANFSGANYLPYDCPSCKHTFLSENIEMENMYEFSTPKAEERFNKIRNSHMGNNPGLYVSEMIPITENYAITFRDPSIYSLVLENSLLDEKFATKYQDVISIIAYIDNIYLIKKDTSELIPVGYKVDPNNQIITTKSKILAYAKILSTFSPDQYNTLLAYMNAINTKSNDITYKKPEVVCPKCGHKIEANDMAAENLVFMRAQLAVLGLTSIN